jgi:hypothetical protein
VTVYTEIKDTVYLDRVKLDKQIDTVYYSEPFKAEISRYSGSEDMTYGKIDWTAETTGKLVNLEFKPILSIPEKVVTNTIEREITRTVFNRGIYAGGMVNEKLKPSISASYIDKSISIDYLYNLNRKEHSIGMKLKVF